MKTFETFDLSDNLRTDHKNWDASPHNINWLLHNPPLNCRNQKWSFTLLGPICPVSTEHYITISRTHDINHVSRSSCYVTIAKGQRSFCSLSMPLCKSGMKFSTKFVSSLTLTISSSKLCWQIDLSNSWHEICPSHERWCGGQRWWGCCTRQYYHLS